MYELAYIYIKIPYFSKKKKVNKTLINQLKKKRIELTLNLTHQRTYIYIQANDETNVL